MNNHNKYIFIHSDIRADHLPKVSSYLASGKILILALLAIDFGWRGSVELYVKVENSPRKHVEGGDNSSKSESSRAHLDSASHSR